MNNIPETFCPTSRQHWREWLQAHHATAQSVWLVYQKRRAATVPGISYAEAVEEALCFGWIDSTSQPVDEATYRQYFSKRKPGGTWSKVNKARVQRLLAAGLLAEAGLAAIEVAKQNGAWSILDEVEELRVPADLARELAAQPPAQAYFAGLCQSDQRNMLQWLVLAKRPETRQARIAEIVAQAAQQQKPTQFRGRPKKPTDPPAPSAA